MMTGFAISTERDTTPVQEEERPYSPPPLRSSLSSLSQHHSLSGSYQYYPPIYIAPPNYHYATTEEEDGDGSEEEDVEEHRVGGGDDDDDVDGQALDDVVVDHVYPYHAHGYKSTVVEDSEMYDEPPSPTSTVHRHASPGLLKPTRTSSRSKYATTSTTSTASSTVVASSSITTTNSKTSVSQQPPPPSSQPLPTKYYPRRPIAPSKSLPSSTLSGNPGASSSSTTPGATSQMYNVESSTWTCTCHGNVYRRKGDLDRHLRESIFPATCDGCNTRFKRKDPRIRHWDKDPACEVKHHVANYGDPREMARWARRWSNTLGGGEKDSSTINGSNSGSGPGSKRRGKPAGRISAKVRKEVEDLLEAALAEKKEAQANIRVEPKQSASPIKAGGKSNVEGDIAGVAATTTSGLKKTSSTSSTSSGRVTRAKARSSVKS
ncbi:hypothetical protein FRB94_008537 [Tulasnella sp. JGI-2019a]|nr:hypothetical protein FRB94_008537 [Tulasnella sp. JGI-2019a]KAG9038136.1 hypothetical protein FRB95_002576 [Tulasnella sp. JGI-2019a]